MKYLKKFESKSVKMFDDHNELISHIEQYLNTLYINQPQSWNKKLSQIVESNGSFDHISFMTQTLKDEVERTSKVLRDFSHDIKTHIRELDEIWSISKILSDKDEQAYELLEECEHKVEKYLDVVEEYTNSLEIISKSYSNISDEVDGILKIKFKLI